MTTDKKLDIDSIFSAIAATCSHQGVDYIAEVDLNAFSPDATNNQQYHFIDDDEFYGESPDLIPVDEYFSTTNFSQGLVALINDGYLTLKDVAFVNGAEPPIIADVENKTFKLNQNATCPVSTYLLSIDKSVEELKKLALKHDFYAGKAICPLWLNASLKSLVSDQTPTLSPAMSF